VPEHRKGQEITTYNGMDYAATMGVYLLYEYYCPAVVSDRTHVTTSLQMFCLFRYYERVFECHRWAYNVKGRLDLAAELSYCILRMLLLCPLLCVNESV